MKGMEAVLANLPWHMAVLNLGIFKIAKWLIDITAFQVEKNNGEQPGGGKKEGNRFRLRAANALMVFFNIRMRDIMDVTEQTRGFGSMPDGSSLQSHAEDAEAVLGDGGETSQPV